MTDADENFHTRLTRLRKERGYVTAKAFSDAIGFGQAGYNLYEEGGANFRAPRPHRLAIIAKALGTTPEWLLYGSSNPSGEAATPHLAEGAIPAFQVEKVNAPVPLVETTGVTKLLDLVKLLRSYIEAKDLPGARVICQSIVSEIDLQSLLAANGQGGR
ncbi:helix-turn-helix domain-containing protein [Nitrospirillum bahiense]|uniref:helix-turn-helix domain-containing protein n=1 Tax=Nitrospirillum amazonense TaxID=28077 RepID=UPI0011A45FFB|nr:helix-turn-helix transcriptional regulator [Nitrospirillum amazonense]